MADNAEFFDILYQQWSKTTGAEKRYWMPELDPSEHAFGVFNVFAVDQDGKRTCIAQGLKEADAEFICGLHGALPDLIRALHDAHDEAERCDVLRDEANQIAAEAAIEILGLQNEIHELNRKLNG